MTRHSTFSSLDGEDVYGIKKNYSSAQKKKQDEENDLTVDAHIRDRHNSNKVKGNKITKLLMSKENSKGKVTNFT